MHTVRSTDSNKFGCDWGHNKMAENFYNYNFGYAVTPVKQQLDWEVKFVSEPPQDIRKSNFFNFILELRCNNGPLFVENATFVEFLNEQENDPTALRNGIKYKIVAKFSDGKGGSNREAKFLYITLVDASTFEPIRYEGPTDCQKTQRVLLTHETICLRCLEKKSCGNKSETPSDPRILASTSGQLQFFLKCNQNCLKGAGNPRDMRRFSLAVSFENIVHNRGAIAVLSEKIFVHNNSKHSKKRKKEEFQVKQELIENSSDFVYIHPKVGLVGSSFSFHSKHWCKPGVSFRIGNANLVNTSIVYNTAMTVDIPGNLRSGRHLITMHMDLIPVIGFYYEILVEKHPDSNRGFLCLLEQHTNGVNLQQCNNEVGYILRGDQLQYHLNQPYICTPASSCLSVCPPLWSENDGNIEGLMGWNFCDGRMYA